MARKKVRMAYITNNSARKTTFKKRKKGMMKKLSELSALCGVDACAVIYSPFDSQAEVWPSPSRVKNVLEKFKNMPMIEKSQKMLNQESFLRGMISKTNEQLKKVRKQNHEKELRHTMFQSLTTGIPQFQNLHLMDMGDLEQLINQKLDEIDSRIENLGEEVIENETKMSKLHNNACEGIHGM
ncbi:agamous-like MADS-box protein AGL80 [Rosa sericea]